MIICYHCFYEFRKEFDAQRALDEEAESTRHEALANRKNGYQEDQ